VQQVAAVTFGGIIGSTRMYVGAHLPLDVVGGVAIGVLCGRAAGAIMDRLP
jgi:membrane-associated phospholipid phosphatase